jgi:hypothetical protein
MKQTAVEWLLENLNSEPYSEEEFNYNHDCWDKAEAMEKEQIKDAWLNSLTKGDFNSADEYYNQTFKLE